MSTWRDRLTDLREAAERRTGLAVTPKERLDLLESSDQERRMLQRDLDLLAWTALDYQGGKPQDLKPQARRRIVQRARVAWMRDPQIGGATDLTLDFVFGRGVQKPKANDPEVQTILDETYTDTDNQLILTSHQAMCALLTDLLIQDNLFVLEFEDGEDGKVKLGLLDHDCVEAVVRDQDNRLRIMYYVARPQRLIWDFTQDKAVVEGVNAPQKPSGKLASAPVSEPDAASPSSVNVTGINRPLYFEHWRNVDDAVADYEAGARDEPQLCPPDRLGEGKVFHIATNRGAEMAFGYPRLDRVLRFASSYNTFIDARIDMMSAAAAFVMKRKIRGTPQQLQRMATQALSRRSVLGLSMEPEMVADIGPKAASILTENDCFDDETELLTSDGWLGLADLKSHRGLRVAAMRDGALVFEQPKSALKLYRHNGEMVRIAGSRVDLLVTPNHRLLVRTADGFVERLAADVRVGDVVPITTDGFAGRRVETFRLPEFVIRREVPRQSATVVERRARINALLGEGLSKAEVARRMGCNVDTVRNATLPRVERPVSARSTRVAVELRMDAWLRWLGWWISEGWASKHQVGVCQSLKSPYLDSIQDACRTLGLPGTEDVLPRGGKPLWTWRAKNAKRLREWLHEHCGRDAYSKRLPGFVFELAQSQQAVMLKALMEGDGSIRGKRGQTQLDWDAATRGSYHTASRQLADDVQRLALNCGHEAAVLQHEAGKDLWRVAIYKGGRRRVGDGRITTVERVRYDGEIFCFAMPSDTLVARRNGRVTVTCNSVDHEPLALNTNAPQAQIDGQMIHGQISAGLRWPIHYLGDASGTTLAGATGLELPILMFVQRYQQLFEELFRFLFDRAIERAVDTGRLSATLEPGENGKAKSAPDKQPTPQNLDPDDKTVTGAYEDEQADEESLQRDLGYEFRMPNPLKRMIGDLVTAAQLTAQAFDPTASNVELSRTLLTIVLGEGFEIEDPAGEVAKIFPSGYQAPQMMANQGPPSGGGGSPFGQFGPQDDGFSQDAFTGGYGSDSQDPAYGGGFAGGNPYGAYAASQSPEAAMEARVARAVGRYMQEAPDERDLRELREAADAIDRQLFAELDEAMVSGSGNGSVS